MGIDCRVEFDWLPKREAVLALWVQVLLAFVRNGVLPSVMYRTANSKKAALQQPISLRDEKQVRSFVTEALNDKAWLDGIVVEGLWHEEENGGVIRFSLFDFRRVNQLTLKTERASDAELRAALVDVQAQTLIDFNVVNF